MVEVRWHGTGGQGVVTAARLLAEAAYYAGFKGVTATPFFGAERRGAPLVAFNKLSRNPIRTHQSVTEPDVVVVLQERLLKVLDVTAGLKPDGVLLINTPRPANGFGGLAAKNLAACDASGICREIGLVVAGNVLANTALLGGLVRATGLMDLEMINRAINAAFGEGAAGLNIEGARLAYERTRTSDGYAPRLDTEG